MGWLSVPYIYQVTSGTQGTQYRLLMLVRGGKSHVKKEQEPQVQPSGCQTVEVGQAGTAGFSEEVDSAS